MDEMRQIAVHDVKGALWVQWHYEAVLYFICFSFVGTQQTSQLLLSPILEKSKRVLQLISVHKVLTKNSTKQNNKQHN